MTLPLLQHPVFIINIPSTGKPTRFRIFTVGEEKILLTAAENVSGDIIDSIAALAQVIKNCAVDPLDINTLTTFDFEYIFIKLREHSVSDVVTLQYTDPSDKTKKQNIDVKLSDARVDVKERERVVELSKEDKISLTLGFPSFAVLQWLNSSRNPEFMRSDTEDDFMVMCAVIKQVTAGDEVFDVKQSSPDELRQFVDTLTIPQMDQITDWVEHLPYTYIDVQLPNGKTERVRNIRRFFV